METKQKISDLTCGDDCPLCHEYYLYEDEDYGILYCPACGHIFKHDQVSHPDPAE